MAGRPLAIADWRGGPFVGAWRRGVIYKKRMSQIMRSYFFETEEVDEKAFFKKCHHFPWAFRAPWNIVRQKQAMTKKNWHRNKNIWKPFWNMVLHGTYMASGFINSVWLAAIVPFRALLVLPSLRSRLNRWSSCIWNPCLKWEEKESATLLHSRGWDMKNSVAKVSGCQCPEKAKCKELQN